MLGIHLMNEAGPIKIEHLMFFGTKFGTNFTAVFLAGDLFAVFRYI